MNVPSFLSRAALIALLLALVLPAAATAARSKAERKGAVAPKLATNEQLIDHGRFKQVHLYTPAGAPTSFVLLLSGDGHWHDGPAAMAQTLARQGAVVAGIDTPQFLQALEADGGECVYPDGDLENLAHFVQAYAKMPGYRAPWIVGYSSGATLGYGVLAQAPTADFAGSIALGFCPELELRKPLCSGEGLTFKPLPVPKVKAKKGKPAPVSPGVEFAPRHLLGVPFLVLLGDDDGVCDVPPVQQFVDAMPAAHLTVLPGVSHDYGDDPRGLAALAAGFQVLSAHSAPVVPPAPPDLGDLPVIEQRAANDASNPNVAIFWSGDGGWAGIDKEVAAALNAKGVSVVGVDSLRYFWTQRTPEGIAADVEKIARHYLAAWKKSKVLLIGYSQGADVLPFAVTRLSPALKKQVQLAVGMGLSDHAVFEFSMTNWVADNNDGPETLPEVARIQDVPFLCVYGAEEDDTICPKVSGPKAKVVKLPGGHHFDGAYDTLAQTILDAIPR